MSNIPVKQIVDLLGFSAGFCTTIALLPQVIKTITTKESQDISLPAFTILALGQLLWLIYGIMMLDIPLIAANFISLIMSLIVVILKIKHG